jgi:sugar phosphate isomerase/epimerase
MKQRERPTIGAALLVDQLEAHLPWLLEGRRDIEIQDPIFTTVLDGDWRALARRGRELLAGHGGRLGIHGPFLDLNLAAFDPRARALTIERLRQGLAFAGELGASHMVVHSPFMSFGTPAHTFTPWLRRAAASEAARGVIEALLPEAEAIGCTLVVENIADGAVTPLLELVAWFDSPLVRASLDTGHALIMQRIGGPTPDQWVVEAGALLGHVHLQDCDAHLDRHWAPGDGNVNWAALFAALAELPQTPRLLLELNDHTQVTRGAAYLVGRGLAR